MKSSDEKTNVMRLLDKAKVEYIPHAFSVGEGDSLDVKTAAMRLGKSPEEVFKTLVTRGISEVFARVRRIKSSGASSICLPILPALTVTVLSTSTDSSITVGNAFFIPRGEHPPCIYPVRGKSSDCFIISMLFSPAAFAAFFRSRLPVPGTTKTK